MINESKRTLVLGATYNFGGDLKPRHIRSLAGTMSNVGVSQIDTTSLELILPSQLTLGVSYHDNKLAAALDYSLQRWGANNTSTEYTVDGIVVGYTNTNTLRAGLEYTPRRGDIRHYLNRVSYRVGAKYGDHHVTYGGKKLNEYTLTAGAGFPINMVGISKIDLGFEWGSLGSTETISRWRRCWFGERAGV